MSPQQAKSIYARIYWAKICSVCGDRDVTAWRSHWNDIQAGFDEIVKDYPDQWNINSYAHIACMGDDREKTLAMMGKIKGPPISDVWSGARDYPSCAEWSGLNKKVKNAKP